MDISFENIDEHSQESTQKQHVHAPTASRQDSTRIESDILQRDLQGIEGVEFVEGPKSLCDNDRIIVILGPSGVGKSTFIQTATAYDTGEVGHSLQSATSRVSALRIRFPNNVNIVLVDTPGFDNTYRSDFEVLKIIGSWLGSISDGEGTLSGIIYLHRITDTLRSRTTIKNFTMIQKICDESQGLVDLEQDLIRNYWGPMIMKGSRYLRFTHTPVSAWVIINSILRIPSKKPRSHLTHIQQELMKIGNNIVETEAGKLPHGDRQELISKQAMVMKQLRNELLKPVNVQDQTALNELLEELGWLREGGEAKGERDLSLLGSIKKQIFGFGKAEEQLAKNLKRREQHQQASNMITGLIASQSLYSELHAALTALQGPDAQTMVDFLNKALEDDLDLSLTLRRHLLHLFTKVIKSAQVYPQSFLLTGIVCNLAGKPKNRGGFGEIFDGKLQGQLICVKAVRPDSAHQEVPRAHAGEFALWAHMSHPNVLPFYGVYLSEERTPRICIVSPWMQNGNLAEYLRNNPASPQVPFLIDTSSGLQYLHGLDIIHADLKACNILISSTGRAMLADFGISTLAMTNVINTTAVNHLGTANWIAPERLTADEMPPPTRQSDIWAFGCTCYEIPFEQYKSMTSLIHAYIWGRVDPVQLKPNPDPDGVWPIMQQCLNLNSEERPSAVAVHRLLMELNIKDDRPLVKSESINPGSQPRKSRANSPRIDYDRVLAILENQVLPERESAHLTRETPALGH